MAYLDDDWLKMAYRIREYGEKRREMHNQLAPASTGIKKIARHTDEKQGKQLVFHYAPFFVRTLSQIKT